MHTHFRFILTGKHHNTQGLSTRSHSQLEIHEGDGPGNFTSDADRGPVDWAVSNPHTSNFFLLVTSNSRYSKVLFAFPFMYVYFCCYVKHECYGKQEV